jgi:hypothetical protein
MTRHEKIDKILLHMANNMAEIPTRPDLIAKNAGLTIEKAEAYLILDLLNADGYAKRIMATNKNTGEESDPHFIALYKGTIFIENGGYKRQHQIAKRQMKAQKVSDYVDFLVKPLGIITAICVITWTTIQILKYLELIPSHG